MSASLDRTKAEALRIAEAWLKAQGWKFVPADVGKRAADILFAMEATRQSEDGR